MGLLELDQIARTWVVNHRIAILDPILFGFSLVGTVGFVWFVAGVLLAITRTISARAFAQLTGSLTLTWVLVEVVFKPIVARDRPFLHGPPLAIIGYLPTGASFPSGHSAVAFAGAFVLSRAAPRARVVWWSLAAITAYSRIYLGVHYPLDVVAGAAVGLLCAVLVMRLTTPAVS